jgi:hypothetical protein
MRIESWVGVTIAVMVLVCTAIAAEQQQCRRAVLPANLTFPGDLEPAIARVYDRSPTFRAQCGRIAAADHARIDVRIDPRIPSRCRAFSVVNRRKGKIVAEVHLPPSSDHTELLAHELEHVIEQIEGLNLRRLSRVKGSGVRETERDLFETDRAQIAGRVVMMEADQHSHVGDKPAD